MKTREARKLQGLCIACGGKRPCVSCTALGRKLRADRKAKRLCVLCGGPRPCRECSKNSLVRQQARRKKEIATVGPGCEACGKSWLENRKYDPRRRDHDHKTGKFRGWLCNPCNVLAGLIERVDGADDEILAVRKYLKERSGPLPVQEPSVRMEFVTGYPRGERNGMAKLSEVKVREIRDLRKSGLTYQDIADRFGVVKSTVFQIVRGERWKEVA